MNENKASGRKIKDFDKRAARVRPVSETWLHNAGLHYLQRFAASSAHFRAVMMRKVRKSCAAHPDQDAEACAALVDALVTKFQASGLLDDRVYADAAVSSLRRRGFSAKAIRLRLSGKGVDRDGIGSALERSDAEDCENAELAAAIRFARRRKLGPFAASPRGRDENRALSALARAGFDYETARRALALPLED